MVIATEHTYIVLGELAEINGLCAKDEIPAVLPPDRRVGNIGFANYVTSQDWEYAAAYDTGYLKFLLSNLLGILAGKRPLSFAYGSRMDGVEIVHGIKSGYGANGHFTLSLVGTDEEANRGLRGFLDGITRLFPQRGSEGLEFQVSGNAVYGVLPSNNNR